MGAVLDTPLYALLELAFRTQYAELKERARGTPALLAGSPGTLVQRTGTGRAYWYRAYQSAAGTQVEDLVAKDGDDDALDQARGNVAFAQWTAAQVRNLRKLGFQVADKGVAAVLVQLHNDGLLGAGLVPVGTLAYMACLNELGARAVSARTKNIDLAARQRLRLGAARSLEQALSATRLRFSPVPALRGAGASTSAKLPGRDGLRVDLLTHGSAVGAVVAVPQLAWHARTIPHFDYLLTDPTDAALLAGTHCIPAALPQAERLMWHKLYSSATRRGMPEKAAKDLLQAATLAAVLIEQDDMDAAASWSAVPRGMRAAVRSRLPALKRALGAHPQALSALATALA